MIRLGALKILSDGSLAVMTHWLRNAGYRTKSAGFRANVNCSGVACSPHALMCPNQRSTSGEATVGEPTWLVTD